MRIEKLIEEEEKYIVDSVNRTILWDKEFIIYQWYEGDIQDNYYESKIKIIFDMFSLSTKIVRVEKRYLDFKKSSKKVSYIDNIDNINELLNKPFILKRRSIEGNIFLDQFIRSNNKCEYILEIEDQKLKEDVKHSEFRIIKSVTKDKLYLNKNMAVPFLEEDLIGLELLMRCFK